jgi:diguanylate cyclase (GGDEF)-like protein
MRYSGTLSETAVLIDVDDPAVERELVDAGFAVSHAPSPSEISLDEADVLLLRLRDAQPLEAFSVVRSAAPDTALVVLTGADREADGRAAVRAGAQDYVSSEALGRGLLPRLLRRAINRNKARTESETQAVTDELSGLPNLRGFTIVAEHHFRMADRGGRPVVLLFAKIDDLERARGELDPSGFDEMVADAATTILHAVRAADYPGRVAEDVFCVILTGDAAGAEPMVLSRLVEAIAVRNAQAESFRNLSLSIGSALYDPAKPRPFRDILDEAMRRMEPRPSKEAGGERSEAP